MDSNKPTVTISKNIKTTESYGVVHALTITVHESSNITKDIFLFEYTPKTPYYSGQVYSFSNVCYPDELENIPTDIEDATKSQLIRKNTVSKTFNSRESLDSFYSEVLSDIRKLLKAVDELSNGVVDDVDYFFTISADGVESADEPISYAYMNSPASSSRTTEQRDGVIVLDASGESE